MYGISKFLLEWLDGEHIKIREIENRIEKGEIVLKDRYIDSAIAEAQSNDPSTRWSLFWMEFKFKYPMLYSPFMFMKNRGFFWILSGYSVPWIMLHVFHLAVTPAATEAVKFLAKAIQIFVLNLLLQLASQVKSIVNNFFTDPTSRYFVDINGIRPQP